MSGEDLLAALGGAAVSFEVVPGVVLMLRPLSMRDAGEYQKYRKENADDKIGAVCKLVALSATMPDGSPLSADVIGMLPAVHVETIAARVADMNGWGEAAGN